MALVDFGGNTLECKKVSFGVQEGPILLDESSSDHSIQKGHLEPIIDVFTDQMETKPLEGKDKAVLMDEPAGCGQVVVGDVVEFVDFSADPTGGGRVVVGEVERSVPSQQDRMEREEAGPVHMEPGQLLAGTGLEQGD